MADEAHSGEPEGPANLRELLEKATDAPDYPLGLPSSVTRLLKMMPELIDLYAAATTAQKQAKQGIESIRSQDKHYTLLDVNLLLGPRLRALDIKAWVSEPSKEEAAETPAV